jgi:hypothetical protein
VAVRKKRFQVKNTKHNSRDKQDQATRQRRASALRALNGTALKVAKGGTETPPPPPGGDPIC